MAVALSIEDQDRINRLASKIGTTPDDVLPFVLRDGFDESERVADIVMQAQQDVRNGHTVPHAEVMGELEAAIAKYERQAA